MNPPTHPVDFPPVGYFTSAPVWILESNAAEPFDAVLNTAWNLKLRNGSVAIEENRLMILLVFEIGRAHV